MKRKLAFPSLLIWDSKPKVAELSRLTLFKGVLCLRPGKYWVSVVGYNYFLGNWKNVLSFLNHILIFL